MAIREAVFAFHHRAVHVPRVRRVGRALGARVRRAESILDVGCGDGTVALAVAGEVGATRVAGVDVLVRPGAAIAVSGYDGRALPFEDDSFDAVLLADVLHHAEDPRGLLRECLRVGRVVGVKDHFQFGWASEKVLYWMDVVGNAAPGVAVRGTYFTPPAWVELCASAGGHMTELEWPLQIHDYPFRIVTRDALQFAARVERAPAGARLTPGSAS